MTNAVPVSVADTAALQEAEGTVTAQLQRRVATLQGKLGRNIKASKTMSSRSKAQPDGGVAQQWRANVGDLEELLQDL